MQQTTFPVTHSRLHLKFWFDMGGQHTSNGWSLSLHQLAKAFNPGLPPYHIRENTQHDNLACSVVALLASSKHQAALASGCWLTPTACVHKTKAEQICVLARTVRNAKTL